MSIYKEGIEKTPIVGDIEVLEDLKNVTVTFITDKEKRAIENLLKAYKEDEAVIEEMAKYIDNHTYRDSEMRL